MEVLLEGQGPAALSCTWDADAAFESHTTIAQPKGKKKTSLQALGWREALVSYRPFLSYNELGSMLDEGPSKLYDALSLVLGLEDLVTAQAALAKSRLDRQQALDAADDTREAVVEVLKALLEKERDDRASACVEALTSKSWGIDAVEAVLAAGTVPQADQDTGILTRAAALESPDPERVRACAAALRASAEKLKAVAGSDAERSRNLAALLESALTFQSAHGDGDCPVCGRAEALSKTWAAASRLEVTRLRTIAAGTDQAHNAADAARRAVRELLAAPPPLLAQLFEIGLEGLDALRDQWTTWHGGASLSDLAGR